jgi:hypothetical protein
MASMRILSAALKFMSMFIYRQILVSITLAKIGLFIERKKSDVVIDFLDYFFGGKILENQSMIK